VAIENGNRPTVVMKAVLKVFIITVLKKLITIQTYNNHGSHMFFEVVLEITLILIFSSFSRNQNQQFSDSEIFKIPEPAVSNKSKVPAQH
jgi:hypothetical protein